MHVSEPDLSFGVPLCPSLSLWISFPEFGWEQSDLLGDGLGFTQHLWELNQH